MPLRYVNLFIYHIFPYLFSVAVPSMMPPSAAAAVVPSMTPPAAAEAPVVPPASPPQAPIETFTDAANASIAIGAAVHFTPQENKTILLLPPGANAPQTAPLINVNTPGQVSAGAVSPPGVAVKDIVKDNLLAPAPVAALFTNQTEAALLPHKDLPVNLDLYNVSADADAS